MQSIFLVDDDPTIGETIAGILQAEGYQVKTARRPADFIAMVHAAEPAVAIVDIFFGEGEPDGEALIRELVAHCANTQIIVISGESDVGKTLSCLRLGALDFLEKPVSLPRLLTTVRNAAAIYSVRSTGQAGSAIIGQAPQTIALVNRIRKVAALNENVLVCGESGTGKELVAENLHLFSRRFAQPLLKINCTALNPSLIESELFGHVAGSFSGAKTDKTGFFEAASGGTLCIDEIGDFPLDLQSKLLRVLQEKQITPVGSTHSVKVDTRLVFATHKNIEQMVRDGRFREDLFFRISTFTIQIPPLRERCADIPVLADFFLRRFTAENNLPYKYFSDEALATLTGYHYPGNIRELQTIVKNAAFFSEHEAIDPADIVFGNDIHGLDIWSRTASMSLTDSKAAFERELIMRRMQRMNSDIGKVAESLGMIPNNLYRKMHALNISWKV
jgi:two-component system nitrogen regulation response regulator NtrX